MGNLSAARPLSANAAAAAEAVAQTWMRGVMSSLPLNSMTAMKAFNDKLEEHDAPYMKTASEYWAPLAKQAPNLAKFYPMVFGDWVTDNVSYARPTVSVLNVRQMCRGTRFHCRVSH